MNLKEFRKNCEEKKIPIIRYQSELLLIEKMKKINPKNILEIGMAVGYSSTIWGLNFDCDITCVELDCKNVLVAKQNHENFNLNKIKIYNQDAKNFTTKEIFDVIFIDAGKSWYLDYYNRYKDNVSKDGIIIFDNVNYHGLLKTNLRKHRTIVRKMNDFHNFINNIQTEFNYKWYDIDDGILIIGKNVKNI